MSDGNEAVLHRLLYRSRSTIVGSEEAIEARLDTLVQRAAKANAQVDVTGALLFAASVFLQGLEGPRIRVEETFERICRDDSHTDLEIIEYSAVNFRRFEAWSMHRLCADEPVGRLLMQLGRCDPARATNPELSAQAISLMATLAEVERRVASTTRAGEEEEASPRLDTREMEVSIRTRPLVPGYIGSQNDQKLILT